MGGSKKKSGKKKGGGGGGGAGGSAAERSRCGEAAKALDALGLRRMVVGHTPQITAGINACCGGRVYRIDTGLSSFYGGMKQCLEVVSNERPRVISSTPEYFW